MPAGSCKRFRHIDGIDISMVVFLVANFHIPYAVYTRTDNCALHVPKRASDLLFDHYVTELYTLFVNEDLKVALAYRVGLTD